MSEPMRLDTESIEAIARSVAELLAGDGSPHTYSLSAAQVAVRLGVTAGWVRSHADELGAIRLGNGSKARLRFDPGVLLERLRDRRLRQFQEQGQRLRRRSPARKSQNRERVTLLPRTRRTLDD